MSTETSASTNEPLVDAVYNELRGRTCQEEAITSAELSEKLNVNDGEANPKTRELIREVMETRPLPVVSGHSGYWVAADLKEMEEYLNDLDSRIAGIQSRKQELVAAYNRRRYADE